jgi:hypothetical protein
MQEGILEEENRAGILLSSMPECVMEKASNKTPQGAPHGEALLMALFLQVNQ